MRPLQDFLILLHKDIKIEFRAKQALFATMAFGVLLILMIGMALDSQGPLPPEIGAGVLWMAMLFAIAIGMNRHDVQDRELEGRQGLFLAPIDPSLIYYAKWMSTMIVVGLANLATLIAFFVILNQPLAVHGWAFVGGFLLGTMSLTGIGTFLATLCVHSRLRDILVPVLLFPLAVPLLLALIRITVYASSAHVPSPTIWWEVLYAYLALFAVLPALLFETLLEV